MGRQKRGYQVQDMGFIGKGKDLQKAQLMVPGQPVATLGFCCGHPERQHAVHSLQATCLQILVACCTGCSDRGKDAAAGSGDLLVALPCQAQAKLLRPVACKRQVSVGIHQPWQDHLPGTVDLVTSGNQVHSVPALIGGAHKDNAALPARHGTTMNNALSHSIAHMAAGEIAKGHYLGCTGQDQISLHGKPPLPGSPAHRWWLGRDRQSDCWRRPGCAQNGEVDP